MSTEAITPDIRFTVDVYTDNDDTREDRLADLRTLFEFDLSDVQARQLVDDLPPEALNEMLRDIAQPSGLFNDKGGWSSDERSSFYQVLAHKLSGVQMADLVMNGLASQSLSYEDARAIGAAVGRLDASRTDDKRLFAQRMAPYAMAPDTVIRTEESPTREFTDSRFNAKGAALAAYLEGAKDTPSAFNEAVHSIGLKGIGQTLIGSMELHHTKLVSEPMFAGCNPSRVTQVEITFNAEGTARLIDAAAIAGDDITRCLVLVGTESVSFIAAGLQQSHKLDEGLEPSLSRLRNSMAPDHPCAPLQQTTDL